MKNIVIPSFTNLYKTFLISLVLTSFVLYGVGLKFPFVYDDAFISMRVSKNFIEGKGLYHNWEEKVQTNTSVLYPIITSPLQGLPYPYSLYAVQLFDVILLALSCYFTFLIVVHGKEVIWTNLSRMQWYLLLVLSAFYPIKFLMCSMVCFGMETQFYIFMIVLTAYLFQRQKIWASFILAGLLIYVRPEGGLLLLALTFVYFYEQLKSSNFKTAFGQVFPYALVGGIIAISYFGFVYSYYGEGMLHTIKVKKLIGQSFWGGFNTLAQSYIIPYPRSQAFINILIILGIFLVKFNNKYVNILFLWLAFYVGLLTLTSAWISAFGWYFSPVLFMISITAFFIVYQIILYAKFSKYIIGSFVLFFCFVALKEARGFIRMYQGKHKSIFSLLEKSAQKLNLLTNNKSYYITLEPLGFHGYFNLNCNFKDYPGLASKESYHIIKERGKILKDTSDDYHANKSHVLLMDKINSHFLIMFDQEMKFVFKNSKDSTNFVKLCKLPGADYNIVAKRSMLTDNEINELKKRAQELGFPLI